VRAAPAAARHDDDGGWDGSSGPGSGSRLLAPSTSVGDRWIG
jgi:hypothetical protein